MSGRMQLGGSANGPEVFMADSRLQGFLCLCAPCSPFCFRRSYGEGKPIRISSVNTFQGEWTMKPGKGVGRILGIAGLLLVLGVASRGLMGQQGTPAEKQLQAW